VGGSSKRREVDDAQCGDLDDAAVLDAQHIDLERPELGVAGAAQVAGRRWHAIGTNGHQPPVAVPALFEPAPQQASNRVDAIEDGRVGRHRDGMSWEAIANAAATSQRS
jgi:hypothetical protein